jgi:hypothetical protein
MKLEASKDMEKSEEKKEKPAFEKYEIESGFDTLVRAEEIKKDMKLMELIKEFASKKKAAIHSVKELKELTQKKFGQVGAEKGEKEESKEQESKS